MRKTVRKTVRGTAKTRQCLGDPAMFDYIILTVGTNYELLLVVRMWKLSFLALEFVGLCACACATLQHAAAGTAPFWLSPTRRRMPHLHFGWRHATFALSLGVACVIVVLLLS